MPYLTPTYLLSKLRHVYRNDIVIMDNSSLCVWEECQRKFLYRSLLSLKEPEEKAAITFGKAFHKFLELYHSGFDFMTSFEGFVRTAHADNSKITVSRKECIAEDQIQEYSMEFGFVLCKKYMQTHPLDSEYFDVLCDADNKPYVETGFALDLPNGILTGLIDLLCRVKYNSRNAICDHKTTKMNLNLSWKSQFNPNNQMSKYMYAASDYLMDQLHGEWITTAIINAIRVKDYKRGNTEDNDKQLFDRIETTRSIEQLEQHIRHTNFQLGQIQQSIDAGIDGFPMHTQSCNTKYGDCEYRRLCLAKDDHMLQMLAETTYVVEAWSPYDILGEAKEGPEKIVTIDVDLEDRLKDKVDLVEKSKYIEDKMV
jgi:hypothetical protein